MKYIYNISYGLVLAFFAFAMNIKSVSNIVVFILFLSTLIYTIKFHKTNITNIQISANLRKFLWCLIIIFSTTFIFTFIQFLLNYDIKINYFDAPLRFVLSASCIFLLAFCNAKNSIEKGLVGIIIGAFGLGIWGYVSTTIPKFMWLDPERAWNGFSNPIPYGLICMVLAFFSLLLPFSIIEKYYLKNTQIADLMRYKKIFIVIKILAFFAGLYGAYQSGSRIALLVFPVFIFIAIYTQKTISKNKKILYFCSFFVLVSIPLLVFNNKISERIQDGFNDLEKYETLQNTNKETLAKNHNYNTSMGLRFLMWNEAIKIITTDNNWIFGIGKSNYMPTMKKLHSEGKVVDEIRATPTPHNEYLNSFVEFGIFGLISLLLIYLFPLMFYLNKRYLEHKDDTVKFVAVSGIILSSGYAIGGLFDCYFWIVSLVNFYVLTHIIFISLILSKTTELNNISTRN